MAGWRGGKWSGRPNQGQIEDAAMQKVAEFRQRLQQAGLSIPEIPPVPAEYIALTITELSVRSIAGLAHEGKALAGLLDMERAEILYEESDPPGRQSFTIAHELGHYFLHYIPAVEMARQPSLFDSLEFSPSEPGGRLERADRPAARYFRCTELVLANAASEEQGDEGEVAPLDTKIGRRMLEDPDSKAHLAKIIRLKELADRTEWEANIFARGLLMPSELVRWLNKKHSGEVEAIAAELGVTATALRYRLNGMNLRQDENMGLGPSYNLNKTSSSNSNSNANIKSHQQGTFF